MSSASPPIRFPSLTWPSNPAQLVMDYADSYGDSIDCLDEEGNPYKLFPKEPYATFGQLRLIEKEVEAVFKASLLGIFPVYQEAATLPVHTFVRTTGIQANTLKEPAGSPNMIDHESTDSSPWPDQFITMRFPRATLLDQIARAASFKGLNRPSQELYPNAVGTIDDLRRVLEFRSALPGIPFWYIETLTQAKKLGEGAGGRVYEWVDSDGAVSAVKPRHHVATTLTIAKLLHAIPPHPNVNKFKGLACIVDSKKVGLVFEKIEGEELSDRWARDPKTCAHTKLRVCIDVAEALTHLDAIGFGHDDLGFRNILRTPAGRAIVIDFGQGISPCSSLYMRQANKVNYRDQFIKTLPYILNDPSIQHLVAIWTPEKNNAAAASAADEPGEKSVPTMKELGWDQILIALKNIKPSCQCPNCLEKMQKEREETLREAAQLVAVKQAWEDASNSKGCCNDCVIA